MQRVAFKMKLLPGCQEEYQRRHAALWPELSNLLTNAGIREYSIFLDEESDTLFAFQKVADGTGSQDLGSNEIVRRWWDFMADIMVTHPDHSPVSTALSEVFYLD
ncbi:MAG: L-rhamnose mutarotase [Lewinellaceae bacterium]|nr:L-rhamnose mutarotase [Lewinellaceae bacterium]HPR01301.1 L-rhamnose mutarotase [Saprospiraceae bacterium]